MSHSKRLIALGVGATIGYVLIGALCKQYTQYRERISHEIDIELSKILSEGTEWPR